MPSPPRPIRCAASPVVPGTSSPPCALATPRSAATGRRPLAQSRPRGGARHLDASSGPRSNSSRRLCAALHHTAQPPLQTLGSRKGCDRVPTRLVPWITAPRWALPSHTAWYNTFSMPADEKVGASLFVLIPLTKDFGPLRGVLLPLLPRQHIGGRSAPEPGRTVPRGRLPERALDGPMANVYRGTSHKGASTCERRAKRCKSLSLPTSPDE